MKARKIKDILKKFHHRKEWLLIKIDKLDPKTTNPLLGHLIAHSPNRDEIYKKSAAHKGLAFIGYSEDKLPKGYAVAF